MLQPHATACLVEEQKGLMLENGGVQMGEELALKMLSWHAGALQKGQRVCALLLKHWETFGVCIFLQHQSKT